MTGRIPLRARVNIVVSPVEQQHSGLDAQKSGEYYLLQLKCMTWMRSQANTMMGDIVFDVARCKTFKVSGFAESS